MKNSAGYTLIEVLTTITIFLLISGAITGLFFSSVMAQRKALASQKVFDNISYALEYMSRALRMAKKDDIEIAGVTKNCIITGDKVNYELTDNNRRIKFRNYKNECQEFFIDNDGRIKETKEGTTLPLTPSDFIISTSTSKFLVFNADQTDNLQPKVTILLDVQTKGQRPEAKATIKIQTTISQRDLDVQE
jgi:prepilin-type N-terminal cleavage/methylation domain-containing protein